MNRTLGMLVAMMMIAVAQAFVGTPAFAGGKATQMWKCELHDDATEDQVMEGAQKWLAAARTMKGGKNLQAYVFFPVAVNFEDDSDLIFVLVAPTFEEWGEFWDGYKGSPAAKIDKANDEYVIAPDSGLWESLRVGEPHGNSSAQFTGKATQMWKCEIDDDATEKQVVKGAEEWLAAARTMEGGKNLNGYVHFPVAVNATGEHDAVFVVTAPTFKEWGKFWDGYEGSPAAKIDKKNDEFVVCPDSGLWEAIKVE